MDLFVIMTLMLVMMNPVESHSDMQVQEPSGYVSQGSSFFLMQHVFKLEGKVETKIKHIEEDIEDLKSKAINSPRECNNVREDIEEMKSEIENLSEELESAKSEFRDSNSALKQEMAVLQERNSDLQRAVSGLQSSGTTSLCPKGWVRFGESCYKIKEEKMNWESARLKCQDEGGYLAEIDSRAEDQFLKKEAMLIGDLDKLTAHLRKNYPDDELLKVWVTYYNQTGRAGLDEMIHPPVKRKQVTNEEKKDKLESVLLKSYSEERILTDTVTPYYVTLQQCLETIQNCGILINSGNLSVLHHSAMQGEAIFHIKQKAKKGQNLRSLLDSLWLGGSDILREGDWQWITSTKNISGVSFTDWYLGEPSDTKGEENCLHLYKSFNYGWNDASCVHHHGYICERQHSLK